MVKYMLYVNKMVNDSDELNAWQVNVSKLDSWEDHVLGTYLVFICLLCYSLNFFVFRHTYRLKKRSLFDILVATLAIDDTLHATISLMSAISCFSHRWVFGQAGCMVYGFTVFTVGTLSIMSITAISLVRHTAVYAGMFYKTIAFHHKVICLLTIVLYSCSWAASGLFLTHSYGNEPFGTACCLEWTKLSKPYVLGLFAGVFVIPVSVTIVCYVRVIRRTIERGQFLSRTKNRNDSSFNKAQKKHNTATKIGIAICVGFMITWTPYAILSFYWTFGDASVVPVRMTVFPSMFAKTSVICNPIIYFWLNPSYRPKFVASFFARVLTSYRRYYSAVSQLKPNNIFKREQTVNTATNSSGSDETNEVVLIFRQATSSVESTTEQTSDNLAHLQALTVKHEKNDNYTPI